ncbi:hypothetical protein PVAND_010323 [Polypedilum vanderplanki]|uniref:Phospholipase B1, membrane-associated n=1 Tax=Polypedilum vanderplanki TaxID=319348 RepID=A0A9J6CFC6_POLVA|nr:hypothetical protein PVAND_010323 [Polypedilum vanderplanki]
MKFKDLGVILILAVYSKLISGQTSFLDKKFGPILRFGRHTLDTIFKRDGFENNLKINVKNNKIQRQFNNNEKFFCETDGYGARSKSVPNSVHRLSPGDIDIVAAIGDSLTASNGAFALDELQVLNKGRGVSWSIGGQGTWREYLTLPNILKEYNPNLYGYSINTFSNSFDKSSKFNVAEAGAMIVDTVHQAKNLVKRMRSDKNVDMKNHWKLVTYMIGGNDFCLDICYHNDQNQIIENAANNLILAMRILKKHLPRTLVNVVLPPDVQILLRMKNRPNECKTLHYFECPCLFSLNHFKNRDRTISTIHIWKKTMERVVKTTQEFHDSDDFEVTIHPFLDKGDVPKFSNGDTDLSYMSKDCFHLSQKGHATVANALWNSMLTPERARLRYFKNEFEEFKCPTATQPFLLTSKNS